jgi:hypothetical protein
MEPQSQRGFRQGSVILLYAVQNGLFIALDTVWFQGILTLRVGLIALPRHRR